MSKRKDIVTMKSNKTKNIVKKAVAAAARMATSANVNSACHFVIYQPKLPKGAEKLRQF